MDSGRIVAILQSRPLGSEKGIETISAQICQVLANQIISGELRPGTKLEENALSEHFGVSRTPVREALKDLAAKRLVEAGPRRGVIVARIGIDQLSDMLEADCEIESLCARLASQKMSALEKESLKIVCEQGYAVVESGKLASYLDLNDRFHLLIAKGTRNETLESTVRTLRDRLAPFRRAQPGELPQRFLQSVDEHRLIVDAISRSDAENAYNAARAHNARLSTGVLFRLTEQSRGSSEDETRRQPPLDGFSVKEAKETS